MLSLTCHHPLAKNTSSNIYKKPGEIISLLCDPSPHPSLRSSTDLNRHWIILKIWWIQLNSSKDGLRGKKNLCIIINTDIGVYPAFCVTVTKMLSLSRVAILAHTNSWRTCDLSNFQSDARSEHCLQSCQSLECWVYTWLTSKWCKIVLSVTSIRSLPNFEAFFCYTLQKHPSSQQGASLQRHIRCGLQK